MRRYAGHLGVFSKYIDIVQPLFTCKGAEVPSLLRLQTALKLINAALPKHKDSQLLRVLKSLALIRLDRADEAYKAGTQPHVGRPLAPCHVLDTS